nr:immunoglobulin light chain junction region [Macaca mulatta]MOW61997.1 immunoglobulin light chain junction region [Macaca mulatta]MOW62013.1 immunoglobulin light chain junction region [Macaca mulatta]MOW62179.1 immunoglobulin light chain junction region [Macaca mulatta]MOW62418.1 immunoglobulin light chain junction region [Macaca mulatta]
CQQYKNYPYSF